VTPLYRGTYLRFAAVMDPGANARVHAVAESLLSDLPAAVTDLIPGYASLYVEFDGSRLTERAIRGWLERHAEAAGSDHVGREVEVPVRYDGEDLPLVGRRTGLEPGEVAARHCSVPYRVYALGFAPGFPFMGEVPAEIRVPRLPSPRRSVPAHSLAIAEGQTGIYPLPSPGGWNLLGRSLVKIYDPHREEPFLLRPGDTVRFVPTDGEPPPVPVPVSLLPEEPERPLLLVREAGLLDLVVDRGRFMVGRFGLGRGGPLDPLSASVANSLVANVAGAPLIEINVTGPVLEAVAPAVLAFAGRGLAPRLNGDTVPAFSSFAVRPGDVLSFQARAGEDTEPGCRGYLAVAGGIAARSFAGSATMDVKSLIGRPLAPGDLLGAASEHSARPGFSYRPYDWRRGRGQSLRLLPGPQDSKEAMDILCASQFEVASADRMGVRLAGPEVPGGELLSEGVPLGAIQVPPGGSPILLLNDRGTLGGYAKPAVLHPADLPRAGQLRAGDSVRFVRGR
jgi:KipI family sensor histidine kinase inhibitor